jgi:hypothetical protein
MAHEQSRGGNKHGYNTDVVQVYEEYYTKLMEKLFPTKLDYITKMALCTFSKFRRDYTHKSTEKNTGGSAVSSTRRVNSFWLHCWCIFSVHRLPVLPFVVSSPWCFRFKLLIVLNQFSK